MPLSLRPTGLSSPAYRHQLDYVVIEDGQTIGRMYEDPHAPADYRWFWSITEHVDPAHAIVTNGRVPTLDEAKAQFKSSWSKVREAREQKEQ
jgi:hypothetical protein